MNTIFTPKTDDVLVAPLPADQYAMVKSSGYLAHYGFGPDALALAMAYVEQNGERVIVKRTVGTDEWEVVYPAADAPTIPDALPDDFQ